MTSTETQLPHRHSASSWIGRLERGPIDYAISVLTVAVATIIGRGLRRVLPSDCFEIYLGAVLLSTYSGRRAGLGPGLVASALSIVALDYFFIPPINAFAWGVSDLIRIAVFAAVAVLIGSLSGRLKKAKADLETTNDELDSRVQQRTEELVRANSLLKREAQERLRAQTAILEITNREQQRLGQDLHDGLIQILTGLRLIIHDVKANLPSSGGQLAPDIDRVETCINDALAQADTISRGLFPVELEAHGLVAALSEFSNRTSQLHRRACSFVCESPIVIDTGVAVHLYRIAQEAVSNALKSGKARQVVIRLRKSGARVILSVADNGIGMAKAKARNGMGLRIMGYRSQFINGELRILSVPDCGTIVACVCRPPAKESVT